MELLLDTHRDAVGESPLWHPGENALYWVDIEGQALNRWSEADGHRRWSVGECIGCIALHAQGGLVAALEREVVQLQPLASGELHRRTLAQVDHAAPGMRFNDGRTDRQGRFWAGTMVRGMQLNLAAGALYRLDGDGLSAPQRQGLYVPNGLAFSPAGDLAYFSDSHPLSQQIWRAPLHEDGTLGPAQVFVDMRTLPGRPDGAAVDAEGCYWICANDAGQVHRFTPDGQLDRSLSVPVAKPSMCCFGGPQGDLLFITSIRPAQPTAEQGALPGAVFVTRPGVCGLAERPFAPAGAALSPAPVLSI
ncbi:SMP-30/gluconolactonase/LRE family protein [Ideonella livida]|nr:SMP-30/gluconolactonase/LRE family protein [Ideonella livida]